MSDVLAAPGKTEPKLDDLMVAMDVVDTIRHDERLAEKELSLQLGDDALIRRLREIYEAQGIEVSDAALQEGVKALREKRFVYSPPAPGLARSLALAWVGRARIGRFLLLLLVGASALGGAYYFAVERPREMAQQRTEDEISRVLPRQIEERFAEASSEAKAESAKATAERLLADGRAALARRDAEDARKALTGLSTLVEDLRREFVVRVVNRRGEASGVWRRPRINPLARNHYLIVEAVDRSGRVIPRSVTSEETGETSTVDRWGVRVSEDVFQNVLADKRDDGIIQQNLVGEKKRGYVETDFVLPVANGAITRW